MKIPPPVQKWEYFFNVQKKIISVIGLFANKTQNKSSVLKNNIYTLKPRIDPLKL